jgi:hypothetical protein
MQETIRYDLDNSRFEHTVKLETWPDGTVVVPPRRSTGSHRPPLPP